MTHGQVAELLAACKAAIEAFPELTYPSTHTHAGKINFTALLNHMQDDNNIPPALCTKDGDPIFKMTSGRIKKAFHRHSETDGHKSRRSEGERTAVLDHASNNRLAVGRPDAAAVHSALQAMGSDMSRPQIKYTISRYGSGRDNSAALASFDHTQLHKLVDHANANRTGAWIADNDPAFAPKSAYAITSAMRRMRASTGWREFMIATAGAGAGSGSSEEEGEETCYVGAGK